MSDWTITSKAYKPSLRNEFDKDKTFQQIYNDIVSMGYETDKGTTHNYVDSYATLLEPYRHKNINFLEIGINFGYSLALWRKYFSKAHIYGIDNRNVLEFNEDVNVVFYDANDSSIVDKYYSNIEFDVIIDDASHEVQHQQLRFPIYFPKLKKDGIYIIEDVQSLDTEGNLLTSLNETAKIIDLRNIKGRYDDVLITYKK